MSQGILPRRWEQEPSLTSDLMSAHPAVTLADPCCSFRGCSDQLLDLKFHLFQGPGTAGHTKGIVILELASGLQLLLTPRGGGDGREDTVELGTHPRDSVFSCFPASLLQYFKQGQRSHFLVSPPLSLPPTDFSFLLFLLQSPLVASPSWSSVGMPCSDYVLAVHCDCHKVPHLSSKS